MQEEEYELYDRNIRLWGREGQDKYNSIFNLG
jgi:molybdopterin/thiamine biosynthesis adenylyltransferase